MRKTAAICLAAIVPLLGFGQISTIWDDIIVEYKNDLNFIDRRGRRDGGRLLDLYEIADPVLYEAALSTAAMIPRGRIYPLPDDGSVRIVGGGRNDRFCALNRFFGGRGQKRSAECSGFLVDSDLVFTAGHCLGSSPRRSCASHNWVFGYAAEGAADDPSVVDSGDVYRCQEVVVVAGDGESYGRDAALVRLDRPVEGRAPLRMGILGAAQDRGIVAIGYPKGLPVKVTPVGSVHGWIGGQFAAKLAVFYGNSGGPVIDVGTGLVVGIISKGINEDIFDENVVGCWDVDITNMPAFATPVTSAGRRY